MTLNVAASGSRVKWFYAIEDSSGDISATIPAFIPVRFKTSDLVRETSQVESDEITDDRQPEKDRQGTYHVSGSIAAPLTFGSHDYLMQAALQSSWVSQVTDTQITFSAVAADNSFNDSASGFITAGFKVGDLVTISGFTGDVANNITDAKITVLTAGKMTIGGTDGDVIVDDAASESVTIATAGDYLEVASTVPTIALLKRNEDTSIDTLYRHNRVSDLAFALTLNASAEITANVIGESTELYTVPGGSTFATKTTTDMMVPTIGYMQDDETAITYLSDYSVQFTNNMGPLFSLFQRPAYAVENGMFKATGTMSVYQPSNALLTKFIDETDTDHIVKLIDPAGNWYRIVLPDVAYTNLSDPVSGQGAIIEAYTFSPGYDGTTTVRLERSV